MTIDKEQLISLLTEKSGLERTQVESQLSELINRIQQAAEEGKTFEIEGFGIFNMKDGNLQFEPHDTLETEINNKYAGMKPIELIGAFKEPEGDEVPEVPEESPTRQASETEDAEEGEKWTFDESAADEQAEPIAASEEESATPEPDTGKDKEDKPSEDAEDAFEKIFGKSREPKESVQERVSSAKTPQQETEKEKDMLGQLLVAAVVVIALGVGGWLIYDIGFFGNDNANQQVAESSRQSSQVADRQMDDTPQGSDQGSASQQNAADKNSEPEQQMEVGNQEGDRTEPETRQDPFGLRGTVNQSVDGYTIVVHSLRSMSIAEFKRNELRNAGYRSLISQAEVGGTTYFRVGIGQFQTVDDAQQAVRELPENYRENNFIKRFK